MKILFFTALLILLVSCGNTSKLTLSDFIYEAHELPENCIIKPFDGKSNLPCDAKSNPYISADSAYIKCFVSGLTTNETIWFQVKSVLFSVYETHKEIGIFGVEMKTEEAAINFVKLIKDENMFNEQEKIYQTKNFALILWQDNLDDPAFPKIATLVEETIGSDN